MMRKLKTLWLAVLSLAAVGFVAPKTAVTASADARDFLCTYSARSKDTEYMTYGSTSIQTYTAEEAAAAGIPEGYENEVFQILNDSGVSCGVFLDFEQEQVPLTLVDGLQFRVYIVPHASNTGSRPQVRITDPTGVNDKWIYQPGDTPTPAGEWTTVTVPYATNFENISKNGMLDKFEFAVRMNAYSPVYVDSIAYLLKPNDGVGPEISTANSITVELGKPLSLNVGAFDVQENRTTDVEYVWEEGVTLHANGTPDAVGTYTLTLQSEDFYGNLSTKAVTVNVIEEDNVAPVIDWKFDTVKTTVGAEPMFNVTATDDSGNVSLTTVWSAGALDQRGKLTAGTHTWTVTASDVFGNTTRKVMTFIVTEDEPQYSFVTNEETLGEKHTVTFDGANEVTVSHGFTVEKPADPVKEATVAESYTFVGWYHGGEEWDFDNPITEDIDLQSQWTVTKRVYRVSIDGVYSGLKLQYGETIPADKIPADPQKSSDERYHYVFAGWYNGDELWNFETSVITGDTDLVPRFDKVARGYTVTFDGENAQEVTYGEKLTPPATPEKEGFIFEGWYSGVTEWDFDHHTVRSDLALTSKWTEIEQAPPTSEDSTDASTDEESTEPPTSDSEQNSENSDAADSANGAPSGIGAILSGCGASVGGIAGVLAVLGAAAVLLKKKED